MIPNNKISLTNNFLPAIRKASKPPDRRTSVALFFAESETNQNAEKILKLLTIQKVNKQ